MEKWIYNKNWTNNIMLILNIKKMSYCVIIIFYLHKLCYTI